MAEVPKYFGYLAIDIAPWAKSKTVCGLGLSRGIARCFVSRVWTRGVQGVLFSGTWGGFHPNSWSRALGNKQQAAPEITSKTREKTSNQWYNHWNITKKNLAISNLWPQKHPQILKSKPKPNPKENLRKSSSVSPLRPPARKARVQPAGGFPGAYRPIDRRRSCGCS